MECTTRAFDTYRIHVRIQGGARGPDPPPLINYKNFGFDSNSGPDPLKIHVATEPAFNVGSSAWLFHGLHYLPKMIDNLSIRIGLIILNRQPFW